MFLLLQTMNDSFFSDDFKAPLRELRKGAISHTEFISKIGMERQYRDWCKDAGLKPDDLAAELFVTQHGFEESDVEKEEVVPLS